MFFCRLRFCSKRFCYSRFRLCLPFEFRSKDICPYNGSHCCCLIFEWILKWIEYKMHPIKGIECMYMQFVSICSNNKKQVLKVFSECFRFCFEFIVSLCVTLSSNSANVVHFKCWTILSFIEMIFLRVSWAHFLVSNDASNDRNCYYSIQLN